MHPGLIATSVGWGRCLAHSHSLNSNTFASSDMGEFDGDEAGRAAGSRLRAAIMLIFASKWCGIASMPATASLPLTLGCFNETGTSAIIGAPGHPRPACSLGDRLYHNNNNMFCNGVRPRAPESQSCAG